LEGSINAWVKQGKAVEQIENIHAQELKTQVDNGAAIVDVRKESEYNTAHIPNVNLVPLDEINQNLNRFDNNKPFYLHCAGGYRSMIALSILKNRGIHSGINVVGGMKAIKETQISLQQSSCSTTS
jgi:rhodanese-related sulfurtransferase